MARIVVIAMFAWGVGIAFTFYRLNRDRPIVKLHEASSALWIKWPAVLMRDFRFHEPSPPGTLQILLPKAAEWVLRVFCWAFIVFALYGALKALIFLTR